MSYWERVALVVSLENNKLLYGLANSKEHRKNFEWDFDSIYTVLTNGYAPDYHDAFQYIDKDEMTVADREFVWDVLIMYDQLQYSAVTLKDTELERKTIFPGFDGNNQSRQLGYVRYLIGHNKFEHIKGLMNGMDSHGLQPHYNDMITKFNRIRFSHANEHDLLSAEEIEDILAAKFS